MPYFTVSAKTTVANVFAIDAMSKIVFPSTTTMLMVLEMFP
jgi:hypothetical protein